MNKIHYIKTEYRYDLTQFNGGTDSAGTVEQTFQQL